MLGLIIWRLVDKSMMRYALDSVSEDEDASGAGYTLQAVN